MALTRKYPEDFERIYKAWPDWPKGRTRKQVAAASFEKVKKQFDFQPNDIDDLVTLIDQMKRDRKSWQRGDKYAPQGLQVWLNQAGWQDEYEKVRSDRYERASQPVRDETPDEAMAKIKAAEEERKKVVSMFSVVRDKGKNHA